ncbi:hypothetical protein KUCAC02_028086, partial [Chaenocephalus aceratus]
GVKGVRQCVSLTTMLEAQTSEQGKALREPARQRFVPRVPLMWTPQSQSHAESIPGSQPRSLNHIQCDCHNSEV